MKDGDLNDPTLMASPKAKITPAGVAAHLVELMRDCGVFISDDVSPEAFADIYEGRNRRTVAIESDVFARLLTRRYQSATGKVPSETSLSDARRAIIAEAEATTIRRPVAVRVGRHQDRIYLDLGEEFSDAVEISADAWHVVFESAGAIPPFA